MLIPKREITKLSENIRCVIDGQKIDFRDNREGMWSILKNDIHTLTALKSEQIEVVQRERDLMADTLANISHQLKTPITSIMIMADLLENAPPDKQEVFLSNIKIGISRMEWLVCTLLKMAKLDAGAIEFSKESIQSSVLVNLAIEPLQILLDVKHQSIEISNEIELFCDRKWTAEALTNVIKNASEYSPKGGKIRIEFGVNPICKWISITDDGEGISKDKIATLFKRFEGSRSDKGYGIGLPLALSIMRSQNGDIDVGNTNGAGATFTLKFFK